MSPVRIAILGGAMVSALAAALVVRGIATGHERPATVAAVVPEKPTVKVLVAARDLATGDRLVAQDMTWQPWPSEGGINPTYTTFGAPALAPVTESAKLASAAGGMAAAVSGAQNQPMTAFVGAAVREPIVKGEPIIATKLVRAGDAGVMAVSLKPGMRAMAVPLTAESAAGGFILPGDHVDVVQSRQVEGAVKGFSSTTVLRNVKVLAIDQSLRAAAKTGEAPASALVGATGTLEVTPPQAELLAMAKSQGQLTLVLRSYADVDGPSTAGEVQGAVARAPTVRVFRAGVATDVAVAR